ncbi:MAG TPA: hypothetical protein VGN97_02510 [Mesorhizobium sp.]|jgi:hypothetical protein|nr:hypothetical protein [Mesorhizobium sp.]
MELGNPLSDDEADELRNHLSDLPAGETRSLSWPEFCTLFKDHQSEQDQKTAVVQLAEDCGCGVIFLGRYELFVRFMRKQARASVRAGRERSLA